MLTSVPCAGRLPWQRLRRTCRQQQCQHATLMRHWPGSSPAVRWALPSWRSTSSFRGTAAHRPGSPRGRPSLCGDSFLCGCVCNSAVAAASWGCISRQSCFSCQGAPRGQPGSGGPAHTPDTHTDHTHQPTNRTHWRCDSRSQGRHATQTAFKIGSPSLACQHKPHLPPPKSNHSHDPQPPQRDQWPTAKKLMRMDGDQVSLLLRCV